MNTGKSNISLKAAFSSIPVEFRKRLIKYYRSLKASFVENQFDACGIRAGKLGEVILRLLQLRLTGTYIPFGSKIANFQAECDKLGRLPKTAGVESLRIVIPRALAFLVTIRNKRDIGHAAGDLDANAIDAKASVSLADWCICELLRITYSLSLEDAQVLLDMISQRSIPLVWEVMGKKRILASGLDYKSQVLLLLYGEPEVGVALEDLFDWTEHSNRTVFKSRIIAALHKKRLVEYDTESNFVIISPAGMREVEQQLLPVLTGNPP